MQYTWSSSPSLRNAGDDDPVHADRCAPRNAWSIRTNIDRCAKVVGDLLTEPNPRARRFVTALPGHRPWASPTTAESVCDPYARVGWSSTFTSAATG